MKIGITGNNGFIGYHLSNSITYLKGDWSVISFSKNIFQSTKALCSWISECDVIVHLAGVNRADTDQEVYEANIKLNEALKEAIEFSNFAGHLIFASSAQENSETLYGKAKKESRIFLKDAVAKQGGKFTGLIIPNVFGPFCKPNYNSFIATFCSKILNKEDPTIINDAEVPLVYVGQLVDQVIDIISKGTQNERLEISKDIDINVSKVLSLLETFNSSYIENNTIPSFNSQFELQLFNTFRSYLNLDNRYPVLLEKHTDSRGFFSEIIRTDLGGQFSFSTTLQGITRGNHFHTRKIERFIVIQGNAKISLRKIGTSETHEFELIGEDASYVDMPIWHTHNITNIGTEPLITAFWINEPYDPSDPDTFMEIV